MKRILLFLSFGLILTGCSIGTDMNNTPTKRVEDYLNNYQTLNSNVLTKIDSIVNNEEMFDDDQKITYEDILKKHYQDLTYEVKDETINGDKATVEVEIEVTDYTKALKEAESYRTTNESEFMNDDNEFDEVKFNTYKLDLLKDSDERVKYTIYFTLTKENDDWVLGDLTDSEEEKILGIYEY